jgi:hypothetical protein
MIIFKNLKHVSKGVFPKDVLITVAKGGSMTTDLMNTWRRDISVKRSGGIWRPASLSSGV